jgi:UPF0755 protein
LIRLLKAIIFAGVVLLFIGAVALGGLLIFSGGDLVNYVQTALVRLALIGREEDLERPLGTDATPRRFTINLGESPLVVARNLANNGFISDAQLFVDYVRAEGLDTQLEAGIYFLNQTQTIPQIARVLIDSAGSHIPFTVLAGQRIEEVVANIEQGGLFNFGGQEFLALVQTGAPMDPAFAAKMGIPLGASLEGFLFPAEYILPPTITALELRDTLLENFANNVPDQWIADAAAQGLTIRDVVIIASIAEREAVWDDEHPLITSVYRNRLAIGMKLDADPTVQYALNGARGRWWSNITPADYRGVVSPYNTYLNTGLPPGPIANPSLSALRAALYPAESSYYYFRARCDGSNYHAFATTYEEHLANGC